MQMQQYNKVNKNQNRIARFPRHFKASDEQPQSSSSVGRVHVSYFEFQGFGPPDGRLGVEGDIYVDMTQVNHALYGRVEGEWKKWPGPKMRTAGIKHPLHSEYLLWCKVDKNTLGWCAPNAVTRILLSSASQAISKVIDGRRTAILKAVRLGMESSDIDLSFAAPPAVKAEMYFMDKDELPSVEAEASSNLHIQSPDAPMTDTTHQPRLQREQSPPLPSPPPSPPPMRHPTPQLDEPNFLSPPESDDSMDQDDPVDAPITTNNAITRTPAAIGAPSSPPRSHEPAVSDPQMRVTSPRVLLDNGTHVHQLARSIPTAPINEPSALPVAAVVPPTAAADERQLDAPDPGGVIDLTKSDDEEVVVTSVNIKKTISAPQRRRTLFQIPNNASPGRTRVIRRQPPRLSLTHLPPRTQNFRFTTPLTPINSPTSPTYRRTNHNRQRRHSTTATHVIQKRKKEQSKASQVIDLTFDEEGEDEDDRRGVSVGRRVVSAAASLAGGAPSVMRRESRGPEGERDGGRSVSVSGEVPTRTSPCSEAGPSGVSRLDEELRQSGEVECQSVDSTSTTAFTTMTTTTMSTTTSDLTSAHTIADEDEEELQLMYPDDDPPAVEMDVEMGDECAYERAGSLFSDIGPMEVEGGGDGDGDGDGRGSTEDVLMQGSGDLLFDAGQEASTVSGSGSVGTSANTNHETLLVLPHPGSGDDGSACVSRSGEDRTTLLSGWVVFEGEAEAEAEAASRESSVTPEEEMGDDSQEAEVDELEEQGVGVEREGECECTGAGVGEEEVLDVAAGGNDQEKELSGEHVRYMFLEDLEEGLYCQFCLVRKPRKVFRIQRGTPTTTREMIAHFEKTHPNECKRLVKMEISQLVEMEERASRAAAATAATAQ
ncbi:hypothetical protein AMATHDRAFT_42737 [Amanita thiersii Skay4041]|uniref:Uncharacterized protein n=1 Tax=Amanita thiersii Skay4041 TaxID=703135 RepID=A0A2A9NAS2_9AGAR|nr:hypothetical protein AMATHDRAFT_42737 [Amanita thiersii Skay4041]